MIDSVNIKFRDNGIIEVEGVKIYVASIPHLMNPPTDCLYSFKRNRDMIEVRAYYNAGDAATFFGGNDQVR